MTSDDKGHQMSFYMAVLYMTKDFDNLTSDSLTSNICRLIIC